MTVTWVVEKDVFARDCFDQMIEHFKANDIAHHVVRIVPFIHEIEGKTPIISGPVVAYGSYGIQKLARAQQWIPGVWSNDLFNEDVLQKSLEDNYLNTDMRIVEFRRVPVEVEDEVFFVKPHTDSKEFAGMVTTKDDFRAWYEKLIVAGYFDESILDIKVAISVPKKLGTEWRTVIVNGKVVEASIYRQYQRVMPQRDLNQEVIDFAEKCARIHSPAPVFVSDVVETSDGLRIVEYNSFNSAGLYKCDVGRTIDAINSYVSSCNQ